MRRRLHAAPGRCTRGKRCMAELRSGQSRTVGNKASCAAAVGSSFSTHKKPKPTGDYVLLPGLRRTLSTCAFVRRASARLPAPSHVHPAPKERDESVDRRKAGLHAQRRRRRGEGGGGKNEDEEPVVTTCLHEGIHDGQRLVPVEYLARMTAETTQTGWAEPDYQTYGLHVWPGGRHRAWRHGRPLRPVRDHAARPAHLRERDGAHYLGPTTNILDAVWEHIARCWPEQASPSTQRWSFR